MCSRPCFSCCARRVGARQRLERRRHSCAAIAAWLSATSRSTSTLRRHSGPCGWLVGRPAARRCARTAHGRSRGGNGARAIAPDRPGWRCTAAAAAAPVPPHASRRAAPARGSPRPRLPPRAPWCGSRAARPPAGRCAPARPAGWPAAPRPRRGRSRSHTAAASSAASIVAKALRRPSSASASASAGRSIFSASSTCPSQR